MSDRMPTTAEVRERFVDGFPMDTWAVSRDEAGRDFDRWLAKHDRQVAERAWDKCATKAQDLGRFDETAIPWLRGQSPYRTEEENNG